MIKHFKPVAFLLFLLSASLCLLCTGPQESASPHDSLKVHYNGDAKIEVGGPYVGVEMHHSSMLPQRISFYYPVANSIDLSTDFWKRDTSFVMMMGLKIGRHPREWLGLEPAEFDLTPYSVEFHQKDSLKSISVSYRFCETKPAMVIKYELTNRDSQPAVFEFDTHLATSLKTSHSYHAKDLAWTDFDKDGSILYTNFDDAETQFAQVFVANAGEKPALYYGIGPLDKKALHQKDWWNNILEKPMKTLSRVSPGNPAAHFLYRRKLRPSEKMTITQIIGSCRAEEGEEITDYLLKNYEREIEGYENSVRKKAFESSKLTTGDRSADHSVHWAKAIMAANAHYIDGEIVPMPCPAEYNFFFTHDVLVTDLAAVNFYPERVKRDLEFVVSRASADSIIPHAYYWKDDRYVTEYAGADNWNNFWFILVSGSYLRHTADSTLLKALYPYITKCLDRALQTRGEDALMYSYRPDWWDIGKNYGPRAYMTILAIKAIREYLYISSVLEQNTGGLAELETSAQEMQQALTARLWDENLKYLVNYYQDGEMDTHYYIGSLLAAHYHLLAPQKTTMLVRTAKSKLLDPSVGIYCAFPMDFGELEDYLNFADHEEGAPFFYLNGGVWPQGNAWYALALIAAGQRAEAWNFIRNTMTLDGVMNGPNGQPAMYEVRNANNRDSHIYGTVDKPQFLWAGAWYLYTLYHLIGISENEWNISLAPFIPPKQKKCSFNLALNGSLPLIRASGEGRQIQSVKFNAEAYPSIVLPTDLKDLQEIEVTLGNPGLPRVEATNSILVSARYQNERKYLDANLKAFIGHQNATTVISPEKPKAVSLDGQHITSWEAAKSGDLFRTKIDFLHQSPAEKLRIEF